MKISRFWGVLIALTILASCKQDAETVRPEIALTSEFEYVVDQFADLRVLRYQVPGFEALSLKEKKLVYYLTQAGLSGRDIIWDQNFRHNLKVRHALENIYRNYQGDKENTDWKAFERPTPNFLGRLLMSFLTRRI